MPRGAVSKSILLRVKKKISTIYIVGWLVLSRLRTKILLIEDEKVQRKIISRQLEQEGYHVLQAENGSEGLRIF